MLTIMIVKLGPPSKRCHSDDLTQVIQNHPCVLVCTFSLGNFIREAFSSGLEGKRQRWQISVVWFRKLPPAWYYRVQAQSHWGLNRRCAESSTPTALSCKMGFWPVFIFSFLTFWKWCHVFPGMPSYKVWVLGAFCLLYLWRLCIYICIGWIFISVQSWLVFTVKILPISLTRHKAHRVKGGIQQIKLSF